MPVFLLRLLYIASATAFGYIANDAAEIIQSQQANKAQALQDAVKARLKGFTERSTIIRMVIVAILIFGFTLLFMKRAERKKLI